MSQLFVLPSLELLLIAGRAVALCAGLLMFAWAFRHWRRAATRDTQRVFEQLDLVRSELLIMKEVMHHSAHPTESPAHSMTPETRLPPTQSNGPVRGYEIAARMARNGAGKDELIRGCGITGHEAELLVKLHGQRRETVAETIGRQPRLPESSLATKNIAAKLQPQVRQQTVSERTANLHAGNQVTPRVGRQTVAAETAIQRTPGRIAVPNKSQTQDVSLPPRSRLVAVG